MKSLLAAVVAVLFVLPAAHAQTTTTLKKVWIAINTTVKMRI